MVQDGVATLECNVTGKPPPRVTWERAGWPVGAEPGLRLQHQNQSLRVERARAGHAGRYSCVAENVAGRATRRFALSVLGEDPRPACGGRRGASICSSPPGATPCPSRSQERPPGALSALPLSLFPVPPLCSRHWENTQRLLHDSYMMGGFRGL